MINRLPREFIDLEIHVEQMLTSLDEIKGRLDRLTHQSQAGIPRYILKKPEAIAEVFSYDPESPESYTLPVFSTELKGDKLYRINLTINFTRLNDVITFINIDTVFNGEIINISHNDVEDETLTLEASMLLSTTEDGTATFELTSNTFSEDVDEDTDMFFIASTRTKMVIEELNGHELVEEF